MSKTVRTTCPYCGVGCGVLATPQPDGSVQVAGDPEHPANFGRLCSKGSALGETLSLSGRLLFPDVRRSGPAPCPDVRCALTCTPFPNVHCAPTCAACGSGAQAQALRRDREPGLDERRRAWGSLAAADGE